MLLLNVKYKLKSNAKCEEKLVFHFVREQKRRVHVVINSAGQLSRL